MANPDLWKDFQRLRHQVSGPDKELTIDDLVQQRRLGNSVIPVVDFDQLDEPRRNAATSIYSQYVQAQQQSNTSLSAALEKSFSEQVGFSLSALFKLAHPAARSSRQTAR